jgi:hypothetical protein
MDFALPAHFFRDIGGVMLLIAAGTLIPWLIYKANGGSGRRTDREPVPAPLTVPSASAAAREPANENVVRAARAA